MPLGTLIYLGLVRYLVSLKRNASNYATNLEQVKYPLVEISGSGSLIILPD